MSVKYSYQSSLELLEAIKPLSYDSCWDVCNERLSLLGVSSVFYGCCTSKAEILRQGMTKSCFYRTNHNPQWMDALGADNFLDNELTASLMLSDEKEIYWADEAMWNTASAEQREQASLEIDLGLEVGVTLQLSSLKDSTVGAAVGLNTADVSAKEFSAYWAQHRLEVHGICQVMDLAFRTNHGMAMTGLSVREVEFLEFLAAGYTLKQMAKKWNRAPTTLNTHSFNCRKKLNAASLEQAVYKAFVLGLIKP